MRRRAMGFLLFLLFLSGCVGPVAETPPADVSPPAETAPADMPPPAVSIAPGTFDELWGKIDGSTATIPLSEAIYAYWGADAPVVHNTTPSAYNYLIHWYADVIFVTYPSEEEFEQAAEKNLELEIIPIVKDAFVFLANVENPVDNLTLKQYQDIYTGKLTNWRQVGGADAAIIPYQRPVNSGSQTLFLKLAMDGLMPMTAPSEWRPESMGSLVDMVSAYDNAQNALGYSVFYYVSDMYGNEQFKLLGVDGVKPTRETIAAGEYPLETYYYAVLRKNTPADHPARQLVAWLLSDEGQRVAQAAGYVPLEPIDGGGTAREDWSAEYLGDTEHSSGTGGTSAKSDANIQAAIGASRPLSDYFYNGVNYIAYINGEITRQLEEPGVESYFPTVLDDRAVRPFTGLPNDYPYVTLSARGYLDVTFPDGNPFFRVATGFGLPLPAALSPYAAAQETDVTYLYVDRIAPHIDLFTLRVEVPGDTAVTERINRDLEAWTAALARDPAAIAETERFIASWMGQDAPEEYAYSLQPIMSRWRNYLSVGYLLTLRDGPNRGAPMLTIRTYDVDTGEAINLLDNLPDGLDDWETQIYDEYRFQDGGMIGSAEFYGQPLPDGYIAQTGAAPDCAWAAGGLVIRYTRPDGTRFRVCYYSEQ